MRNLREQVINVGGNLVCKLANHLGNATIKIGEQSRGLCLFFSEYEPQYPMELLKENIEK